MGSAVAYFKVPSWNLFGRTEQIQEIPQTGQMMFRPKFETGTYKIQNSGATPLQPTCPARAYTHTLICESPTRKYKDVDWILLVLHRSLSRAFVKTVMDLLDTYT
jgi:hypothetical protein